MISDAWGKYDDGTGARHPLERHAVDVAACFEAIAAQPAIRRAIEVTAGRGLAPTDVPRLSVIAYLHDVGKLNAGFQFKVRASPPVARAGHLSEAIGAIAGGSGLPVMEATGLFTDMASWGKATESLMLAAIAHHGRPVGVPLTEAGGIWRPVAGYDPNEAARVLGTLAKDAFPDAFRDGPGLPDTPALQHLFAGLVALADQIGSDVRNFPFHDGPDDTYPATARGLAAQALTKRGVDPASGRDRADADATPPALFGWPEGAEPSPMQRAVATASTNDRLLILESETGSGKTEAAFLRYRTLFLAGEVDALYFALPTRAAAAQIHGRIDAAARRFTGVEAVRALPGYLGAGEASGTPLPEWQTGWDDDPSESLRDARWAAEAPRRFLAAQVAVGTVDQVLLAGLQAKWAHMRAASLSRALLVVDELHASDLWMGAALESALAAHLGAGGHALLMSATLGGSARRRWLCGRRSTVSRGEALAAPYPPLSCAAAEGKARTERTLSLPSDARAKRVAISARPLIDDPGAVAAKAVEAARAGAKVLVIRNTVDLALTTFAAVEAADPIAPLLSVGGIRAPHHSRFAAEDRVRLDGAVEATLGRMRPAGGAIVIGTQTLEQSLDIDADFLITDLCPVDVLLQRIGRLHRHDRTDRAEGFAGARCLVLTPETLAPGEGLARFGLGRFRDGGGIYDDMRALEATRRSIGEGFWTIPADNRRLVEAATHPDALSAIAAEMGEAWVREERDLCGAYFALRSGAKSIVLDRSKAFDGVDELFGDSSAVMTRLGEERFVIDLPAGTTGPFGGPVTRLALRARDGVDAGALDDPRVTPVEGGFVLGVGGKDFLYGRTGLATHTNEP